MRAKGGQSIEDEGVERRTDSDKVEQWHVAAAAEPRVKLGTGIESDWMLGLGW